MKLGADTKYVGIADNEKLFFENQFAVPGGFTCNSYVIIDEKCAVIDGVEEEYLDVWLKNVKKALGDRKPEYLVVLHMEPDHSGSIAAFAEAYPGAKIVSNPKSFAMMKAFYRFDPGERAVPAPDGYSLSLGKHVLTFTAAPMLHWPEVNVAYDEFTKTLFSADVFGSFGMPGSGEKWEDEARRYYFGIVGKYGAQAAGLLKKLAGKETELVCPLHGRALAGEELSRALELYGLWSEYKPEDEKTVIVYSSVYGNTQSAAMMLAEILEEKGKLADVWDLGEDDAYEAVASAFAHAKLVLATTTYNGDVFPLMKDFLNRLAERGSKDRTVALIENGSWAPAAARAMKAFLEEKCKNVSFCPTQVKILSAMSPESQQQIETLADELIGE